MILTPQRALDKIGKGTVAPVYLLMGQELYWRDRVWSALKTALGFDGASSTGIEEMDLRRDSVGAIVSRARDRNLWIPRQLLLIRNAHALSGAKALEELAAYSAEPSADSVLVFEMTDVDLDAVDWRDKEKIKTRQEHWGELAEVVLLASPGMAECLELIRREAALRGRKISVPAAENLAAMLNRDLGRIARELEKLCLYREDGEEISASDVSYVVGESAVRGDVSLQDALASGSSQKVLCAFDESVPRGAYLPLVLAEVARYLRQLLLLRDSKARDSSEASRLLWNARLPAPQSAVSQMVRQARAVSARSIGRCLQLTLDADLALRSSPADDRLIVERCLLRLTDELKPAGKAPLTASR